MKNIFSSLSSKVLKRAALGLALTSLAAGLFPRERRLTSGEVRIASSIFDNQIDYEKVRIAHVPLLIRLAVTPNGRIYVGSFIYEKDFSCEVSPILTPDCRDKGSIFIHEMTHVFQRQSGHPVLREAAHLFLKTNGRYDKGYRYPFTPLPAFDDLNIEQQAEVVASYWEEANATNTRTMCDGSPYKQEINEGILRSARSLSIKFQAIKPCGRLPARWSFSTFNIEP